MAELALGYGGLGSGALGYGGLGFICMRSSLLLAIEAYALAASEPADSWLYSPWLWLHQSLWPLLLTA